MSVVYKKKMVSHMLVSGTGLRLPQSKIGQDNLHNNEPVLQLELTADIISITVYNYNFLLQLSLLSSVFPTIHF